MIIDCHGHYTTAPKALEDWRNRQVASLNNPSLAPKAANLRIGDDELRESIEANQLKLMRERGIDPETGFNYDDTKRYIEASALGPAERQKIYEGNARRVFPRLDRALKAKGR